MNYSNKRYEGQGIHVLDSIFTVKNGVFKILLINRKLEPFKNMWSLVGGALYNDETAEDGLRREVAEKVGIKDIEFTNFGIYSRPDRAPVMRMLALSYISVIDMDKVELLQETTHTNNAQWFDIDKLPKLAFDHDEIVAGAIAYLRKHLTDSNILKGLFPKYFTLPDLFKAHQAVLGKPLDRRNFRKKMLSGGIIEDTGLTTQQKGVKTTKLYKFTDVLA